MARRKEGSAHGRGKKGSRAYGRNKAKCERYRVRGRREANKARRMAKRERRYARRRARRESPERGSFYFSRVLW